MHGTDEDVEEPVDCGQQQVVGGDPVERAAFPPDVGGHEAGEASEGRRAEEL